jgi:hypothetical protein
VSLADSLLHSATSHAVQVGESTLTLRDVMPSDMSAVLTLHTHVFGPGADAHWFAWKYGQEPNQGQGRAVGAWHNGKLVAYCGGIPRTLRVRNKNLRGLQIGDVMVHPAWRGILSRRGPFFQVSKRFYDKQIGPHANCPYELGFGFPNERHLRLAVLLGLLRDGGVIEALHWSSLQPKSFRLPWHWLWRPLAASGPRFEKAVSSAWKSMQAEVPDVMLGQRDAAYVRWRYVDRPGAENVSSSYPETIVRYHFFELRRPWSNFASGVAVMDLRSSTPHWLDWVGPVTLMRLVSQACRVEAARSGAAALMAWASSAVADQLAHSDIERREVCAGLGIPASSNLPPHDMTDMPWWLMGGDTDFL